MKLVSGFEFAPSPKYRAVLTCDVTIDLEASHLGEHFFVHDMTEWGNLMNGKLTIYAGYASDLCSPGFCLFGRWYGTPSRGAELAAFVHDFARQFGRPNLACSPWDRKQSDDLFFDVLTMTNFRGRSIYHGAVAGPLGSLWILLNRARPKVSCKTKH